MSMASGDRNLSKLSAELSGKWGWFIAFGVLLLVFGIIALGNVVLANFVTIIFVGAMMLVSGITEIIHAFGVKTWSSFFFWILSGLLYTGAGIVTFYNPVLAAGILSFLLAAALLGTGFFRIWSGFQLKPAAGWGWIVTAGVITALLGLIIALRWPVNSLYIFGLFLAIDLIFQGWSYIAFGLGLKKL